MLFSFLFKIIKYPYIEAFSISLFIVSTKTENHRIFEAIASRSLKVYELRYTTY